MSAAECADSSAGRPEVPPILCAMFERKQREGQALAAAVELAEELAARNDRNARALLDAFFSECGDSMEGMVLVPAGPFLYGDPPTRQDLPAFYMDRYPVTNRDYERMVPSHRRKRDGRSDADDQPVIYVSWHEALLYCRWRGGGFRLPAEQEWEKAARGTDGRRYPWGNEFFAERCNTYEGGKFRTTPVGSYGEQGRSPYGCEDMAGNVWEWTASREEQWRVLRGGAWGLSQSYAACSSRLTAHPRNRGDYVGFRCARTS